MTPTCPEPDCGTPIVAVTAEVDAQAVGHRFTTQCGHQLTTAQADHLWRRGYRWTVPVVDGASLAAAERHRQVHEEGYTAEHDAEHADDLPWVAWSLLDRAIHPHPNNPDHPPNMWPRARDEWKEHPPMRALIIAAALIEAEIDRRLLAERTYPEEK
jgi:hypothetical protein